MRELSEKNCARKPLPENKPQNKRWENARKSPQKNQKISCLPVSIQFQEYQFVEQC
jgi:hypothetical protein